MCLLSLKVSRSRSPLTSGAREGLICAVWPELPEGARILCAWANERELDRTSSRGLRIAHCCAKGQDGGGVYTSSDPPPPCPQVFLNFLIGIWSGADVEIATTAASAAPAAAGVGPLNGACCGALLLGRCRGRVRLSLPLRCGFFLQRVCPVHAATDELGFDRV